MCGHAFIDFQGFAEGQRNWEENGAVYPVAQIQREMRHGFALGAIQSSGRSEKR